MTLFDKTERGREEILLRGNNLAPRLRTLLLLVDGKTSMEALLIKVAGLGLGQEHLSELLAAGMIQIQQPPQLSESVSPITQTKETTEISSAARARAILPEGQTQYEAIYNFYNETIKSMIGLRGYSLQLKVEKASSVDDFRALRTIYLEAILKAKGKETTRSLRDRLDQLLYMGMPAE
ncbi:hypothetical protein [Glaciimonas soli]|uniref:Uncharacterized protein n=1 Tax=Glaciimonas soli TaxID=2590999 RepID=A0A843YR67_9BURK|nr:hypothetical protein [Glaciimonas soli]MQQ99997.1 hypothetical protein [Glaciimonas soli]